MPSDDMSLFERTVCDLILAVLTPEERQLLAVFNGITESRIRQALIDVATAAATRTSTSDAADRITGQTASSEGISVRRVRRELWQRVGHTEGRYDLG
jgi:hypothetical protein